MYVSIFRMHSPIDGHLRCFHILTIVNSATRTCVSKYLFQILFSILLGTNLVILESLYDLLSLNDVHGSL